ncbi:hypothetical protein MOUN0_M00122 [Monosporozyma unispora]
MYSLVDLSSHWPVTVIHFYFDLGFVLHSLLMSYLVFFNHMVLNCVLLTFGINQGISS